MNRLSNPFFLKIAALILSAVLSGCATNPVTGGKDLVLLSEQQEIELGKQNDPKIRQEYGVYNDPALQSYVENLGRRLAAQSHRPNLTYHFAVLDSDQVNAFALPGGYIYVTRGIMAYLNSEAELAAVLGHEIGHVTARHSVRQYTSATTTGLVIGLIGGGQAGQTLMNVLGSALLSGYGRDHELQADRLGAEYLSRSGYDPDAMLEVVGVLKNQEEAEKKRAQAEGREPRVYHGVFASHPSADQRLQEVVAEARKFKTNAPAKAGREEYLKRMDNVVFGDSVREGIRHGSNFYHRDLDLAVNFPNGWRLENNPQSVTAVSPGKDALVQMTMEKLDKKIEPQEYLRQRVKARSLAQETKLEGTALPAHTGVTPLATPFGTRDVRVMVLFRKDHAFTFYGTAKDADTFKRLDNQFLTTARSLHALNEKERQLAQGLRIRAMKARTGDTFAALAKRSPLNQNAELTLRLINDMFPSGEPVAGDLIKVVE